jgi:gas vesicle protein
MNVKEKLNDWKSQAESLKLQMHLGKNDAKDAFEEKKKEMSKWLDEVGADIKGLQKEGQEDLKDLKSKVENLQLQLALKKADSLDQLKENQKKLNDGFNDVKYELNKSIENGKDSLKKWADSTEHKVDQYHSRFDLFKLQLSLGMMEGEEKMEEKRKEVVNKISEFKQQLEGLEDKADLKWDNFKNEIGSAWDHVKKAF